MTLKIKLVLIGTSFLFVATLFLQSADSRALENINTQSKVPAQNYVSFCREDPSAPFIMAYTAGFTSGAGAALMQSNEASVSWCIPDSIRLPQKAATVCTYLTDHPNKLHEPMWLLTQAALSEAWPC